MKVLGIVGARCGSKRVPLHMREVAKLMEREDIDSLMGVTKLPAHYHPEKIVTMQASSL